jgi:hypothetical protein
MHQQWLVLMHDLYTIVSSIVVNVGRWLTFSVKEGLRSLIKVYIGDPIGSLIPIISYDNVPNQNISLEIANIPSLRVHLDLI